MHIHDFRPPSNVSGPGNLGGILQHREDYVPALLAMAQGLIIQKQAAPLLGHAALWPRGGLTKPRKVRH